MNKAKQIWDILFPYGFMLSYVPAIALSVINILSAYNTATKGYSDWLLFWNCLGIVATLGIVHRVYRFHSWVKEHRQFMSDVIDAVRPQLDELHVSIVTEDGIDFKALEIIAPKAHAIIDAEVQRRKSLEHVSKTGRT